MMTLDDIIALKAFTNRYPTWWYKIGVCDLTRDFDCAPQGHSPEHRLIRERKWPDDCFQCDHKVSIADAIYEVMEDIEHAVIDEEWPYEER